jgi:toxoflavin synthase
MLGPLDGTRMLDLACGFGLYTQLLKQHGAAQVIGVDISPEMVRTRTEGEDDGRRDISTTHTHGHATNISHRNRGDGWRP